MRAAATDLRVYEGLFFGVDSSDANVCKNHKAYYGQGREGGPGGIEMGGGGSWGGTRDYIDRPRPTYRYTVTTRKDSCGIKMGSDYIRASNVSLILHYLSVRDKATRQRPQTTSFLN